MRSPGGGRLLLAVLTLLAGAAAAQKIECVSCGLVSFTPSVQEYLAATQSGFIFPDAASPAIRFRLKPQGAREIRAVGVLSSWLPPPVFELQARYTVLTKKGKFVSRSGWVTLTGATTTVCLGEFEKGECEAEDALENGGQLLLDVEYRLRVTGNEPAGSYDTPLTYSVDGNTKPSKTAQHPLRVVIPVATFLELRIGGVPVGQSAEVVFDYTIGNAADYLRAVTTGVPLTTTGTDFSWLEVSTNNPRGYTVTVTVTPLSVPRGSSLGVGDILLKGVPADGQVFSSSGPTSGFVPLVVPGDFTVRVDGGEVPGFHRFAVSYQGIMNP